MSALDASPFAESKSRRWIWIVPSVLLHGVILGLWLRMPEPEPRQPGARKLSVPADQAEALREHVEEANLRELRAKVADLQSIKAAMAEIRAQEMAQVGAFEATMKREAPRDIAELLGELAAIYASVHEDYERIEAALDLYAEQLPAVRQAAENDLIDGLRALPVLEAYWGSFEGMGDRFEVAFYETGAKLNAIEVKLEWMESSGLMEKIEALKAPMAETYATHREAWGAVPASWKRENSFRFLNDDLEKRIETVRTFRQREREGMAATAQKREELEAEIAGAEAEHLAANEDLKAAEVAMELIDRGKNPAAWQAKREEIRTLQSRLRTLNGTLRDLNRALDRTTYQPDQQLARSVREIENRLNHALPPPPERGLIDRAVTRQEAMVGRIGELIQSVEGTL